MATLTLCAEPGVDWKSASDRGGQAVLLGQCRPAESDRPPPDGWAGEPASDDLECIGRVQGGDEEAACGLVERLYPTIIRMVRSHLPRRTHEDDLVQAVFAKVFGKL